MCKDPASPSSNPGDHADCGDDTQSCPQCRYWSQDHHTEVSRSMNDYAVRASTPGSPASDRFEARLSSNEIRISLVLEWAHSARTSPTRTKRRSRTR